MTPAEGPSEILRSVATLAAAASHEINNPLMALIASLELLERTQTPNAYGQGAP
jgi:signal transduction histidine kinase